MKIAWMVFCLTVCFGFLAGFVWLIHLSRACVAADLKLAEVLHDPSWTKGDWLIYLGCCAPLGFALIWGVRFWEAVRER
jgi:hypothetical protein